MLYDKKHIYAVYSGNYGSEGFLDILCNSTKKLISQKIKSMGFLYNKEQDLFLNKEASEWKRIERHEVESYEGLS